MRKLLLAMLFGPVAFAQNGLVERAEAVCVASLGPAVALFPGEINDSKDIIHKILELAKDTCVRVYLLGAKDTCVEGYLITPNGPAPPSPLSGDVIPASKQLPRLNGSGVADYPLDFHMGTGTTYLPMITDKSDPTLETGTLENGICSICKKQGLKSTVTMDGMMSSTAVYCGSGHYGEKGKFVSPPACNAVTQYGRCSRGHTVMIQSNH